MAYSMDSSGWIDLWVNYYPPDVFPSMWTNLEAAASNGTLFTCDEIVKELGRKDDGLHDWVKGQNGMIVPVDPDIERRVIEILGHHPRLIDTKKNKSGGDPWVIALAKARGLTVVTSESEGSLTSPRIPDVCKAMGVHCVGVLQFFREQGWRI